MTIVYDLGSISTWISSFGTIAAVVTAIYLANKDNRKVAKVMTVYQFGENECGIPDVNIELLQINIVNTGNKTIHLMKLSGKAVSKFRSIELIGLERKNQIDHSLKPGEKFSQNVNFESMVEVLYQLGFIKKLKMKTVVYYEDIEGKKYKKRLTVDFTKQSRT
ncbi:hypothetical protein MKX79_14975 [Viridibacillus sp. FSL R5-0468]|uniref:hypothetical protein n=1 Tax=Viridibacillus sp. FSL R5-0468 TaxID=2921640 RepID=UPI0030F73BFF